MVHLNVSQNRKKMEVEQTFSQTFFHILVVQEQLQEDVLPPFFWQSEPTGSC